MTINRRTLVAGSIAAGAAMTASSVFAQGYPAHTIRLVVPYPPGGGTDFFARLVATEMGNSLGQTLVVENRAGAGTLIGAEAVARAQPDGYTFLLGDTSTYASNRSLYAKLPYDADKDFAPITLTGRFAIVLLVNTDKLKVNSVKELIEAVDIHLPIVRFHIHKYRPGAGVAHGIRRRDKCHGRHQHLIVGIHPGNQKGDM